MADKPELSKEEEILGMMKRVLTDVARDTHVRPGLKHPLSDNTIHGIRDCLALIAARQAELAAESGHTSQMRPRFADEPRDTTVVKFDVDELKKGRPDSDDS
ncbi:MAG: segregation and condensation protein A [Pseudomonadota bacterium]|nr:MAG: segregation and condensation protein A [Pseudomonadota bacterium]